ncbi:MAG: hypothetical protein DMG70_15835 [Acidobacteria bacterium]|nr:MAG: hypothetical protein DMG70_15835 [Acidobacteriota bacterium]
MVHDVMVGTRFLDHLAGESRRVGGGQEGAMLVRGCSDHTHHVVKAADFCVYVVGPMAGLNALMVRTTIENDMALEG